MNNKEYLNEYTLKINNIKDKLKKEGRSKDVFPDILALKSETEEYISSCKDETMYAILYNTLATIMTAPEGCSVFQLEAALNDAISEIEIMREYI